MAQTTIRATGQKRFMVSYICESCAKPSISLTGIQKTGTVTSGGMPGNKRTREMENVAGDSCSEQLAQATREMESGIENAITHNAKIDAQCLHCKSMQAWATVINNAIKKSNSIGIINGVLTFVLCVIGFFGLMFLISGEIINAESITTVIIFALLLIIRLSLAQYRKKCRAFSIFELRNRFQSMDINSRPCIVTDESKIEQKINETNNILKGSNG